MAFKSNQSFQQRLNSIQSVFTKTIQSSKNLIEEMNVDIQQKEVKIADLIKEKESVELTRNQTSSFINNLEKLITQ